MRVVLAGGTGFLGAALARRLRADGHEVAVLSRGGARAASRLPPGVTTHAWGQGAAGWESLVEGAFAVVNLAGEPIAQRWTAAAKERIVRSRVEATDRLVAAMAKAASRPSVLLNASAVGFYGDRGNEELTEESGPGRGFLSDTCLAWEEAARKAEPLGVRVVRLRIGLVLGEDGGALSKMLLPFRLGAGGPLGSGRQLMPWIHRDDLVALALFALATPAVSGPLNATAPAPVTMKEFAATLGRVLHRPAFAPAPAFALKVVLGEMASLLLEGQRVVPAKAVSLGFRFRFTALESALSDLLAPRPRVA